jgi:hypothetical protein
MIRKTLFAAAAAALMSTPAWAVPDASSNGTSHGNVPSKTPVGAPGNQPSEPGDHGHGKGSSGSHGQNGSSHRCHTQRVGFIVAGTLVSQELTANGDGTYSGEITVKVTHTNHQAVGEKEVTTEKTYTLTSAQVTFALSDTNADGAVGLDDLVEGDRVMLVGKITKLANKHCDRSKFTAERTIRHIVFLAPETAPAS